jgi:uroporphyrinogen decarboxylase
MEMEPVDRLVRRDFGYMEGVLDSWRIQGLAADADLGSVFLHDRDSGKASIGLLGWGRPSLYPEYDEGVVQHEGDYDIVQDNAGRWLRCFRGRTQGFMPTYVKHAVTGWDDWENDVKPRLDPATPQRIHDYDQAVHRVAAQVSRDGRWLSQNLAGPYMYLRALLGPEELLLAFYDMPDLIHDMLQTWLRLNDGLIRRLQETVEIDELFFAEDICYNHGLLISPATWREFLKPQYLELIGLVRSRQNRDVHIQIDSDGNVTEAIPLYMEIGMDIMSPFEVAAGNDVLAIRDLYPRLRISGGIDKRVLAEGLGAIDDHLERIVPTMRDLHGYIPTCDHHVPLEVSLENFLYYRRRIVELGWELGR